MATARIRTTAAVAGLLSILLAAVYTADLSRTFRVLGLFRQPGETALTTRSSDLVVIADTPHCEDLSYHKPSNLLFTACEADRDSRYSWFPPLAIFKDPSVTLKARGSIHVLDPKTMKARRLELEDFEGPFVTHGIDVISDPDLPDSQAVYIVAVNHVPNYAYYGHTLFAPPSDASSDFPKARSRIEIFHHEIGTTVARHVRSVWHPLIRTPNDVVALSPKSFFVTNDHVYREGFMRTIEDIHFGAKWTDTIHIDLETLSSAATDTEGVKATVALDKMHNNNGLGHGRTPSEILVAECASGVLNIGHANNDTTPPTIGIEESVRFDSIIDNPSYFADPFADAERDASSYILPGLGRAWELHTALHNRSLPVPVMVWSAKARLSSPGGSSRTWETKLLLEDDGSNIRSASSAVQVALDPSNRNQAWLFVTGFISDNIIAAKVDV